MIAGLSKAITLHLAALLALASVLLTLLAFLAPVVLLHAQVALLTVAPAAGTADGPTVLLGALGSCARRSASAALTCTRASLSPLYDLSALPAGTPDLPTAPTPTTPAFLAAALALALLFLALFAAAVLGGARLARPAVQRLAAWVGLLAFMIGLTASLVLRMWFGKAVEDFNRAIQEAGAHAPPLVAAPSNGFTMLWVGYAFQAVPLVCALARLHVAAGGK